MTATSDSFILKEADVAIRLDKILANKYPNYSRNYFQHLIDEGFVLLNNNPIKKRDKAKVGDTLSLTFIHLEGPKLEAEDIPLDILYEDDHIIAINKPIKMVVHPGAGQPNHTFVNALLFHVKDLPENEDPVRPGIVHRLDKDTSGVLIAAKSLLAHNRLVDMFKNREMHKEYIAICKGIPKAGLLSAPIRRDPYHREKMCVLEGGKEAVTEFIILKRDASYAFVLAKPKTGRTHQIRVHLKHLGTPIVGDPIYGKEEGAERLFLHAHTLEFNHPITGNPLKIVAPLPEAFDSFAKKLKV